MTGICGLAKNYWQLFLARVGVGVGEATLTPAVYSLIPDYFPKNKLGTAVGFYMLGMSFGTGFALVLGGAILSYVSSIGDITFPIIGSLRPWQVTFVLVGFPGIFLALLIKLTIREPARRDIFDNENDSMIKTSLLIFLRNNKKTLSLITLAYSFGGMVFYGFLTWIPEHLRRSFDWDISNAGYVFGLMLAVFGSFGAVLGGKFHDYMFSKGYKDAPIRCALIIFSLLFPIMAITPLITNSTFAVAMLGIFSFTMFLQQAMSPVAIQMIAPNHIRAQVVAIFFFIASFCSIGIGPSIVAICTDYIFQDEALLRYSISSVSAIFLPICIIALYLCLKPYKQSVISANNS
jgi:MFS family permease